MSSSATALPAPRRRRSLSRILLTVFGLPFVLLGALVVIYGFATTPRPVAGRSLPGAFDPDVVGRLEQQAWEAYYYRQWPRLFDQLLRLSRSQFNLSLPQALYASYVGTRAQVAWARHGNEGGEAEAYMRRFYEYVREPVGGRYDPRRAAELEIRWWAVHRARDQSPDHSALTAALAETYAEVYQRPAEQMLAAAEARAEAMDLSDRWIREGKAPDSYLLAQIADHLTESYRVLADAVAP